MMNSHTQIQNTLNHPPLQPYPIKIETEHKTEVGTRTKKTPKKEMGGIIFKAQTGVKTSAS